METNTVLLKIEDYNELRDFKKEISENGKTCFIESIYSGQKMIVLTPDELVLRLKNELDEARKYPAGHIAEYREDIVELNNTLHGRAILATVMAVCSLVCGLIISAEWDKSRGFSVCLIILYICVFSYSMLVLFGKTKK